MPNDKLRRQIAFEAARLMYARQESEYLRAKQKAAKRCCAGWIKPCDLPSNREIRDQIQVFARTLEGEDRTTQLREMRLEALRLMRILRAFRPRLIGSTLTGHVRRGSDIDVHVFADHVDAILAALDNEGASYEVVRKRVRKAGAETIFTHVHVQDRFPFELTLYPAQQAHYVFKSSITGKAIERASIAELEAFLQSAYPQIDLDQAQLEAESKVDRFQIYQMLLLPLAQVKQSPKHHPEGDALEHSLQVFDLARNESPYDEEFLLAALLHDVGKAIDPHDHVAAGLEALDDTITPRTIWLIAHHMDAHALHDQTIGHRHRRRLEAHPDYEELLLLGKCDRQGRQRGVAAPDLEEALDFVRELARMCGE
ncbi:MAG TPA: HD domain-containing protein [Pirellulales bacterium]|jgi:predicted nucleotidyltransferase|nr:HD domain-containing protein [Pirellulales bacterium]